MITAAPDHVPQPLVEQLREGGRNPRGPEIDARIFGCKKVSIGIMDNGIDDVFALVRVVHDGIQRNAVLEDQRRRHAVAMVGAEADGLRRTG